MGKKIGILTIHGMGEQGPDFDKDLRKKLLAKLAADVRESVEFESIFYQDVMQANQTALWRRMGFGDRFWSRPLLVAAGLIFVLLPGIFTLALVFPFAPWRGLWGRVRKFFLFSFADAASYEHDADAQDSVYVKVNQKIRDHIDKLGGKLDGDARVVIIAHSLGGHVISNYIWDAQRRRRIWLTVEPKPLQRLDPAAYLFTAGCNIPFFVSGLAKIEAIRPPNPAFQWINFYDPDDVLGWPLKPLSKNFPNSYDKVVTADVPMDAGSRLISWTPLSHPEYWRDRGFLDPVAERINKLHESIVTQGIGVPP